MSHLVSVLVAGVEVRGWTSYEIRNDITAPPGTFSMQRPFDADAWRVLRLDAIVRIVIDGTTVLTGFIERSDITRDDSIAIAGRDRYSRLEESAPTLEFRGLGLYELVRQVVDPWFPATVESNARNRALARGRGKKAKAGAEPLTLATERAGDTRIDPGQTRAAVVDRLLEQAGYLAFSAADGRELVIGKPHYEQAPQYRLFRPAPNSDRANEATVIDMEITRSTEGRFSSVLVVGSGVETDANYGPSVASRSATAFDGPGPEGTGGDFLQPKRLIVQAKVASLEEAEEFASQELARRNAGARRVACKAEGHGQHIAGVHPTIFVPDTTAWVEHERSGYKGLHLITACSYSGDRGTETTDLELVPKGVELSR